LVLSAPKTSPELRAASAAVAGRLGGRAKVSLLHDMLVIDVDPEHLVEVARVIRDEMPTACDLYAANAGVDTGAELRSVTFVRGTATTTGYAGYEGKIDYFMELVPSSAVVLWSNLPCAIEPSGVRVGCEAINRALADAPARWRNLQVVDWAATAGTRSSYIDQDAPARYRVHYSDAGYAAWSRMVKGALDAEFPTR